ncbi:phosphonate C-P lyase system protein PhnH [Acidisphaera sp. S103]|uniref:phosphonate C-P lyase system protein PhnH n=1 Tax=Acidisphaera sp. S103 TaxID=1747223 RepID=UPI00131E94CA|nr:phosphonate C-P lyase system protein PhnH [Acidisphaera sp. S103]
MSNDLSPAFADPIADAQSCFRSVLDAMARPGHRHATSGVSAPAPLCDAAAAVLLTLADHETPLWLDPAAADASVWITFHTGAPAAPPAQAMFAMALSLPDLTHLSVGTDETPETSATVILQVASLTTGQRYVLEGPGLREPKVVAIDGLPPDFAAIWQRNHAQYPLGVDLILCAGNQLTALPRSVSIKDA